MHTYTYTLSLSDSDSDTHSLFLSLSLPLFSFSVRELSSSPSPNESDNSISRRLHRRLSTLTSFPIIELLFLWPKISFVILSSSFLKAHKVVRPNSFPLDRLVVDFFLNTPIKQSIAIFVYYLLYSPPHESYTNPNVVLHYNQTQLSPLNRDSVI